MKRTSSHHTKSTVCNRPSKCPKDKSPCSDDIPSDTEASILYIHQLFPTSHFNPLPPIILKHQIYSLIHDRTSVDREIIELKDSKKIRLIKLDTSQDDYAIMLYKEYCTLISNSLKDCQLQHKVHNLLQEFTDTCISKDQLTKTFKFCADDISTLVTSGILILKDVINRERSWWFSIPGISIFKKDFMRGKSTIIQLIKKIKYKEILQSELEKKRLSVTKLPMEYHIHYLIGTELVNSVPTTSGSLLKLNE